MATKEDIKLSVTARDRLRKELRNSPFLRDHLDDPAKIVRMKKDELLQLADKCGIDARRIVEEERLHGKGIESILTPEEVELWRHSEAYPAFQGTVQVPIRFEVAGKSCERLLRVEYQWTPEWEYYDLTKKKVMTGWPGSAIKHSVRSLPSKRYSGDAPEWIDAEVFAAIGVLSDAQEDEIDALIERQCRDEDKRRRKAAGIAKSKTA